MKAKSTPTEASRLRHAIDEGRTEDKVDHPDPATAPLGTDAEASGHPVGEEEAATAHREEVGRDVDASRKGSLRGFGNKGVWAALLIVLVIGAMLLLLPALG